VQRRLALSIHALKENPRPPGCERLQGAEVLYRVRVGDYRIIYPVQDAVLKVLVAEAGHRSDLYWK